MWASVIANVIAGIVSGALYQLFGSRRLELKVALATAVVAELILKGMVLGLSKPFEKAWELEKIIGIPTVYSQFTGSRTICLYCARCVQGTRKSPGAIGKYSDSNDSADDRIPA